MRWITALDLERWADHVAARTALSEVVNSLIRASAREISSFRFPTGDSAQLAGYDGRLTAKGVDPYVPDGESVWEFGVSSDIVRKANEDYQQRTESPGAVNPRETTFVFVTPRRWDSRSLENWRARKQRDGQWKDVRVIDGVALEEWLSQHPAVAAKLAREVLGVVPNTGTRSIAEYWNEYASRFQPPLDHAVLLCDRQERAKDLTEQMLGAPQPVVVRADSTDEVVAFVIATILAAEDSVRKFLEARTLVLDTEEAARQIGQKSNMVFIVRGSAVRLHGSLARASVTIVPTGRDSPGRTGFIGLDRPSTRALSDALRGMGFDEETAYQLARKSGRSVTVLARQIPHGGGERPAWVGAGGTLIPALLAGGWNGDAPQDQAIVTLLANGGDYAIYEAALQPLERQEDPRGSVRRCVNEEKAV